MRASALAVFAFLAAVATASADAAGDFFKGRTVTLYIGYGPGGGYDLYCRVLAPYLARYLPGNPTVVAENLPGAGSLKLANELYNVLPKDGTALGMIGEVLVINKVLGDPQAKFDPRKFNWIGRLSGSDPVLAMRPDAGITSLADATRRETSIGVPGAGSAAMLTLTVIDNLLGAKFKLVSGYEGSAQIRLAVERGEVQGMGSTLWPLDKNWVIAQKLKVIYETAPEPVPDLPNVRSLYQFGRTADEQTLLRFFSSYTVIGRSILAPPGVPSDRVAVLRAAFDKAAADPSFVAAERKASLDADVLDGRSLQARVTDAASLSGRLLQRAREVADLAKN